MNTRKILGTIIGLFIITGGAYYLIFINSATSLNIQKYENTDFGYEITYPENIFTLDTVDNPAIESETRDIGELKLNERYWVKYSSTLRNPKISWIVNLDENSISNECGYSTNLFEAESKMISGKEWRMKEIVSGNGFGGGANYYKNYYYKGEDKCVLLFTHMSLNSANDNSPELTEEVLETQKMLEDALYNFAIK